MFFELVGTFVAGIAAAGVVMLVNKVIGGRLPKWVIPIVAGCAMIITTISSEYSWYERTRATLPDGMVVASTVENKVFYRPWTYAAPFVMRFSAVDLASVMTHPAAPNHRLVRVVFMGRWSPVRQVRMLFDCQQSRRVDVVEGLAFDPNGLPDSQAPWIAMNAADPLLMTVCAS